MPITPVAQQLAVLALWNDPLTDPYAFLESLIELPEDQRPKQVFILVETGDPRMSMDPSYRQEGIDLHVIAAGDKEGALKMAALEQINRDEIKWIHVTQCSYLYTDNTFPGLVDAFNGGAAYRGVLKALGDDWLSTYFAKSNARIKYNLLYRDGSLETVDLGDHFFVDLETLLKSGGFRRDLDGGVENSELSDRLAKYTKLQEAPKAVCLLDECAIPVGMHLEMYLARAERYGVSLRNLVDSDLSRVKQLEEQLTRAEAEGENIEITYRDMLMIAGTLINADIAHRAIEEVLAAEQPHDSQTSFSFHH
jgi:hypothetical protein